MKRRKTLPTANNKFKRPNGVEKWHNFYNYSKLFPEGPSKIKKTVNKNRQFPNRELKAEPTKAERTLPTRLQDLSLKKIK
jgi:hypothetical protein